MNDQQIIERLQVLEEKFEFQEQTIDTLNGVIVSQQKELDALLSEFNELLKIVNSSGTNDIPNTKPPHY